MVIELALVASALTGLGAFLFFRKREPAFIPPPTPPGVVAAVMSAVNVGSLEGERAKVLHKVLEAAEVQAIHDCIADGIDLHDAKPIIARKAAYREAAMEKFYGGQ